MLRLICSRHLKAKDRVSDRPRRNSYQLKRKFILQTCRSIDYCQLLKPIFISPQLRPPFLFISE